MSIYGWSGRVASALETIAVSTGTVIVSKDSDTHLYSAFQGQSACVPIKLNVGRSGVMADDIAASAHCLTENDVSCSMLCYCCCCCCCCLQRMQDLGKEGSTTY